VLCYALIPFFGYRVAILSTIVSYWSQLMIPFAVSYYRKSVKEWLGSRKIIFLILAIIIVDLSLANYLMRTDMIVKIGVSVITLAAACYFYRRYKLHELV